ncbi:ABC transporter substrate-binding protein [Bradyrhizobium sp. U87765 SZCCT0131]|uniref:ABC transporter substrate-binding protein n=1 Tax=unclassified Bradyrhizobium TaxID=2631580 RepID=UPI001BA5F16F|nr:MULTISPECIES: ABC transporter substrate-binding protein [unclassified Bradyrhizobium]MBR1220538.1 ABC transporter substrate-binding protein [Bradyrhizobium sp. U87765 SZCCT0131]MBR1263007.1 ABC transporter substrate-binding protein [Bradyrhizobium sp. U87765 SZCCT0134]MBR1307110.1 ABC transporter substrate-binding protein [Bradyrhizobium sp. U87765 SZCCT0110]MBR1323002.1 ABC transporter substrate-binding protein [Bradyrhizobium sp. U87765 SZCCT0109]MBR1346064.1 ABC transporter substrate-bin
MITRRTFTSALAGAALAPAVLRHAMAAEQVRLCTALSLSGPFAMAGQPAETGARLAVSALAADYGLDAALQVIDDEGNPGRAMPKIIAALQQGVRFFSGAVLSNVGLPMSAEIANGGGVYMSAVGADEITGADCRRSTFRWPVSSYGAVHQTIGALIDADPKAKRWYTITPKYVFGEAMLREAQAIFKQKNVEHVGNSFHAMADTEFSGYLASVAAAKPDVLAILNFGPQSTNTLRQAADFGLKQNMKIVLVWGAGAEQYAEIGSDVLEDVYVGAQYDDQIDSAGNRRLVELFEKRLKVRPSYAMVNGFVTTELLMRGIKAAGSAEPARVIKALEGLTYEGPTGEEQIRAFDHQVIKNYYLLRGKAPAKKKGKDDYVEIVSFGKSFVEPARSDCKMT